MGKLLSRLLPISSAASALSRVATYQIPSQSHPFHLIISHGSVVDFTPKNPKQTAIVNAANQACLGGGGVDGAISAAGGRNLLEDRQALPEVGLGIRVNTGSAVITGPNSYDKLHTSYVIHAVGPNYRQYKTEEKEGDELLSSAYTSSLQCAKDAQLEAVAFSLLSAGIFRGSKTVKDVLTIGMNAVYNFEGYNGLKEVHFCAFSEKEADTLLEIASGLGLESIGSDQCDIL